MCHEGAYLDHGRGGLNPLGLIFLTTASFDGSRIPNLGHRESFHLINCTSPMPNMDASC